jgi:signal-transduction protein with cAMP-binding, CBS, and nucleotidyltransferase domain
MRKALFFLGILSDSDVEWIIRNGGKARVPAGTTLIQQGKPTDSLYFVLDGEFEVFTSKAPRLAVLKAGEVMGEISFVDSRPPTASVRATLESQVGLVPRALLAGKLKEDMGFSSRLYRAMATFMADRLRTTVGNFGTGAMELDEEIEDVDEVAPHLMDNISMAGARFSEMQRRTWGRQ